MGKRSVVRLSADTGNWSVAYRLARPGLLALSMGPILASLALLPSLGCLPIEGRAVSICHEYRSKRNNLFERRKEELPTIDQVKKVGKLVEIKTSSDELVFLYLVERCVGDYHHTLAPYRRDEDELRQRKESELAEYLLAEKSPIVTFIHGRKGWFGDTELLFVCCNGRMWEVHAYTGMYVRLMLNEYSEPDADRVDSESRVWFMPEIIRERVRARAQPPSSP